MFVDSRKNETRCCATNTLTHSGTYTRQIPIDEPNELNTHFALKDALQHNINCCRISSINIMIECHAIYNGKMNKKKESNWQWWCSQGDDWKVFVQAALMLFFFISASRSLCHWKILEHYFLGASLIRLRIFYLSFLLVPFHCLSFPRSSSRSSQFNLFLLLI